MSASERVVFQVDAIGNFSNVIGEVNKLQSRLQSLKLPSNLNTKFESNLKDIMNKYEQFQTLASKGVRTKGDFSKLNSSAKDFENSLRSLKKELNGVTEQKLRVQVDNLPEVKALEQEIKRLQKTYTELNNLGTNKISGIFGADETQKIRTIVGESKKLKPALENAFAAIKTGNIDDGLKALDEFEKDLNRINGGALNVFQKANPTRKADIQKYISEARRELILMGGDASEAKTKLEQLKADRFTQMASGISTARAQLDNLGDSASKTTREILNTARATQNMESQLTGLQTQANYFFGLQNMIQLFRRGLSDTIQTVRDLDKAMTDTAVVTDMTVSDLWAQLPDYTKLANKLGATTQGAYETMTLYYQQGLNKEETFEIGEETMKMARIAGLDYAQTTNMMTAALRGFNMELNQTSAKRVNDVYSELAAITASDTRELGLAMERTASIAHSANMDFGNTTAFLAQMIETTREAPENLGTAMKTIIARFQELKENPYQISEVEGEEVDFNRVDKALKSIGVDLMDNRDKFRDLDDVFLDISSRWDGLSQTQQRYVATIAAGARQQSRFLAMVQNYDRLKELTDAAANSEGASDVQFSKTLDSMEAKLNKLNNAWDQFAMGITNNELIKKGTSALVKILDAVNKFEAGVEGLGDKIGGIFGDIFKSVTSFTGLLLGFKGLGKLTDIGIGMLGGMLGMGKGVKTSMFGGMSGIRQSTNMAQAKAISSPIVAAINKLTAVVSKKPVNQQDNENIRGVGQRELKNRRNQLQNMVMSVNNKGKEPVSVPKSFSIDRFSNVFQDLNREEQAALYRGQKGTRKAIQKSFEKSIDGLNVSKEANKAAKRFYSDLDYAMANGSQEITSGLTKSFDPVKVGKMIGGDVGEEISNAARQKRKEIIRQGANLDLRGKQLEGYWRGREKDLYGSSSIQLNEKEIKANTSRLSGMTSAVNGAGSAFMQLGMTMQSIGFEKLGGVISTIGSSLLSMGMMAETAAHAMSLLKIEASGVMAALPGIGIGLGLAAVAFGAAFAAYKIDQKHIKEIRKSGKEIVDTYSETTKSVQENLNKIDKIQPDWNKWISGVDANGHNINLGSEEFQDYKNAVKDLTKMHPELIKGYNAEGEILVDNNTVLQEAIRLEKERQKQATEDYLKNGQKIIDRRNSTKRYQKSQSKEIEGSQYSRAAGSRSFEKSQIQKDAQEAANAIKKVDGGEEVLKKWGVTFDELGNITEQGINAIREHGGDMQNALVDAFSGTEITDAQQKLLDSSNDAIATLGKDFEGIEKASQETFDALKTYAQNEGILGNLDSDLIGPYQQTLKKIAEKDISWDEMQGEVDALGKKYQNLGGHLQDYHKIQSEVEEAQKEFGTDLDIDAYQKKVDESTAGMDEWIDQLSNSSDQADQVLAEWFTTQKERLTNLSQSLPTLEEGFNTLTNEITSANAAYDNWNKRNEEGGDYYTASDGFKKMYEEVNDGVDNLGKKSQSWWSAAEAMMGEDYIWDNSSKAVESHMKQIGTYFEEGKQGVDNFLTDIADKFQNNTLADGTKVKDYITANAEGGLDFNIDDISDEKFEQLAAAIGLSTDAFTALLNKARQFYDIDFSNVEDMRAAIAGGETAMIGKRANKEGQQNLYMRESEFRNQLRASGVTDTKKIQEAEDKLSKAGTILMKDLKEISTGDLSKYIKDWGLANGKNGNLNTTDAQSFIASLNKLQYNKDEIQEAFQNNKSLITDAETADFETIYSNIKASEDPATNSVMSIQGTTEGILSAVNSIALNMGILTKEGSQEIDQGIEKAKNFDTDVTNYRNWKDYDKQRSELESSLTATIDQLEAAKDKTTNEADKAKIEEKIADVEAVLNTIKDADLSRQEFYAQQGIAAEKSVSEAGKETKTAYSDTAIGKDNKLDISKLDTLIEAVHTNVEGKNNQNNVIGQYLQNSAKILAENKASNKEIATSMQSAAQEMAQKQMKPADIAAALNQGYGTHLSEKDITTNEQGKVQVNLDDQNLQEQLANLQANVTANITSINVGGVPIGGKATGQNNPNSAFHRTGTMARGSRKGYTISGRPTLMGEEGEEVVWEPKRNEAYIVGSNGPQFGNISKNAVVWNAQQTKKIKKNSKTTGALGTGARGITPIGTMKGGNAGGGGGGMTIPGTFDINATANVQEVTPPVEMPEIPVKGKLEVEGSEKGGLLNKIKGLMGGDKKGGPSIKVTAEATKVNVGEEAKTIKVTGNVTKLNNEAGDIKGIKATARVTKVTKSGIVTGEPVKVKATAVVSGKASGAASTATVKTKADNTAQKDINSIKHKGTVLVKTKADNAAQRAINNIKGTSVTVHIKPSFEGTWTKNATVHVNHDAKGQNNYIAHRTAPSFGSAASGRGGKLGPKGKGGLTLTGEEGFEIAWLPSENRSMILGAKGPQMLMLPSDAVVWTHEQSKKILKKHQSIAAGSMANSVGGTASGFRKKTTRGSSGGSSRGSSKSSKKKSGKKGKDKDKQNTAAAAKVIQTAGKINLWWWNMTKKVEATQRKIDQAATEFNKAISKFGATTTSLADVINNYRKPLDLQKTYNTTMVNKADSEFNVLDYGNKSVDKKVKKAQKKVNKAQKKYNKKKTKSNKKALNKAKKQLNNAKTGLNYETISYDVTEKKTTGKGKKKKTTSKKVTKKSKINLAPYIYFDSESGAYQVNYTKINKNFGKNKSKADAVGEAAKKKIEDLQSKRNTAEDNIIKAQEALEELGKKVSETFFQWENELTEVYNLTQQIANLSSFADRFDSQIELGLSKLSAGFGDTISTITDAQSVLSKKNNTIQNQVTVQQQMIDARQRELDRMLSSADEQALINKFTNMSEALAGGKEAKQANINFAKEQKTAADMALSYLKNVRREADGSVTYEIDWKAFEAARYSTTISNVTYEKIKKYLDDLNSAATEFNDSIKTQTDFIKQTYDALKEYQDYIVDFEDTIIKGVEEEIEKETQNTKKISDSIRDNLKKLLDEVKNKLDERRKQEDNLKTEQDIAQKQQRLAALRADTSGGHQVEIAQLEKEITEAQQSYQRTLEDQLLDRLQQQADQAAEQRDRLIELQEATNRLSEESNRELVNMWLKDPDKYKEELKAAWLEAQGYDEKGIAGQATLLNQWKSVYTELTTAIKQSGFDSENGIFQATANNTDTLVNLVSLLVKGQAEANVTTRNTKSIDSYEISAESARILKNEYGLSAKTLADYGYKAEHLIGDASNPTFSAKEVKDTGKFSATDLKNAGINTAAALHAAGFNATEVKNAGFNSVAALKGGNFTAQEVKSAGFNNISDYINNYNAADASTAFSLYELSTSGNKAYAEHAYWEYLKAAAGNGGTSSDELKRVKEYAERAGYVHAEWVPHFVSIDGDGGVTWKKVLEILKSWKWSKYRMALSWRSSSAFINAMNTVYKEYAKKNSKGQVTQSAFEVILKHAKDNNYKAYKTGGLATQTGPAWLDGTPSKPELVLNPTDTKNFLALKDVLSNALSSTKSIENTYGGDTSYEININVDHLNNDYDVDKVAERVKRIIIKDAGYRNVTQVRNFR